MSRTHGKASSYQGGCRCRDCKDAAAARQRAAVLKRRDAEKPAHIHGTTNGYGNYACRCDKCKAAWAAAVRYHRVQRLAKDVPVHVHGTADGYGNYRCTCEPCMVACRERARAHYRRVLSASARGVPSRSDVCKHGHDITEGSPHRYVRTDGRLMCRTCNADRQRTRRT